MKTNWSKSWVRSIQPRKQKKYVHKAPLHIKRKLLGAPLSKDLQKEYKKRSISVRVGDTVKIITGQFKGKMGKIEKVNIRTSRINIKGADQVKSNGQISPYPIHPSNIVIITPNLSDKKRKEAINRK